MAARKKRVVAETFTTEDLKKAIDKQFGEGTMRFGSDPELEIQRMSTGVLAVDEIMRGGLPRGRHVEIFGSSSIGKTSLSYYIMAAAQLRGEEVAYVDAEKTFNAKLASHCGVDLDRMAYHEQVHGPRCVDFVETLVQSRLYSVVVVDSISALVPLEDVTTGMEASSYGMQQAKMMSKALRKLTAANTFNGTTIVWINQTRDNVGVSFGKKTTTSGGRAMGFYATTRIEMSKLETLTKKGQQVDPSTGEIKSKDRVPYGHRIQVRIEKEKSGARPLETTTIVFDYEQGKFDEIEDLIYLGVLYGLVHKKNNTWWIDGYEKKKVGTGRKGFKKFLRKHPDLAQELRGWIIDSIEEPTEFASPDDDDDGE